MNLPTTGCPLLTVAVPGLSPGFSAALCEGGVAPPPGCLSPLRSSVCKPPWLQYGVLVFTTQPPFLCLRGLTKGVGAAHALPAAADRRFVPQAQVRLKGAGLGAKGSAYGLSGADSYKDAVRKAMFARFTEME